MMKDKTCIECKSHEVINDPDPNDWFCDDDVAVVCTLVKNPKQNPNSKYSADHSFYRCVQVGIRPYRISKESIIPSWCPKKEKTNETN